MASNHLIVPADQELAQLKKKLQDPTKKRKLSGRNLFRKRIQIQMANPHLANAASNICEATRRGTANPQETSNLQDELNTIRAHHAHLIAEEQGLTMEHSDNEANEKELKDTIDNIERDDATSSSQGSNVPRQAT